MAVAAGRLSGRAFDADRQITLRYLQLAHEAVQLMACPDWKAATKKPGEPGFFGAN
jgi:ribosomal protein L16/L10AE